MVVNNYVLLFKLCECVTEGSLDIDSLPVEKIILLLKSCIKGYMPDGIEDDSGKVITALTASKNISLKESGVGFYILYTYCKLMKRNKKAVDTALLLQDLYDVFCQCGWKCDEPLYTLLRAGNKMKIFLYVRSGKVIQAPTVLKESFVTPVRDELQRILSDSKCYKILKYSITPLDSIQELEENSNQLWSDATTYLNNLAQKSASGLSSMRLK